MMRFSHTFFSRVLAPVLVALLVSCSKSAPSSSKDTTVAASPQDGRQNSLRLMFSTAHPNYSYALFVNGEPVQCGTSPGFYSTTSFPFKKGSNDISISMTFLPKDKLPPSRFKTHAFDWDVKTRVNREIPLIIADKFGLVPYDTNQTWEVHLFVTNDVSPDIGFEKLGTNRNELIKECCDMSRKIAVLLQKRDTKALGAVFSLPETEVERQFAQIQGPPDMAVSGIGPDGKVDALSGDYFIVVFCGADKKVDIGEGFVSYSWKESKDEVKFAVDNIVFARQRGKWMVRGANDQWLALNADELNKGQ
jgi:hypothetical protein